jgi:hypothetical protein
MRKLAAVWLSRDRGRQNISPLAPSIALRMSGSGSGPCGLIQSMLVSLPVTAIGFAMSKMAEGEWEADRDAMAKSAKAALATADRTDALRPERSSQPRSAALRLRHQKSICALIFA